jgi:putative transposase
MSRHRSPLVAPRHDARLRRVQALKAEPPCWGSRRLGASLRVVEPLPVHPKRVLRLRRAPHVVGQPTLPLRAKRTPPGSTPRPTQPDAWWGLDLTTLRGEAGGWG